MTDEGCTGEGRGRGHTYTEAEVKVLTETATRVAYALGRKDAAEEFDQLGATLMEFANNDRTRMRQATDLAMRAVYKNRADGYGDSAEAILRVSRSLTSQPAQAASDATSGVPGHQEVSEAVRSRCGLADVDNRCGRPIIDTDAWQIRHQQEAK